MTANDASSGRTYTRPALTYHGPLQPMVR